MIAPPPRDQRPASPASPASHPWRAPTRVRALANSFRYAFAGVRYLLWTQRNAKIHSAIGALAVALGLLLQLERGEWLALTLTITLVFMAEGFNTAIEAAVDLAAPSHHPLAKIAKDVAAGTVLLTAIAAVVVGLILFLPHLLPLIKSVLRL